MSHQALNPTPIADYIFGGEKLTLQIGSPEQEVFCQYVAAGYSYAEAYAAAYEERRSTSSVEAMASRLSKQPHVIARIMQIRAKGLVGFEVERGVLVENLLWALNTARERGATDQVRKIVMDIGKLFGLVIDKAEAEVMHKFQVMKDVQVDGAALVFDVGDNKSVHVKGERVEGELPTPNLQSTQTILTPPDTTGELDAGELSPFQALEKIGKTLKADPIPELEDDEGGFEVGTQRRGRRVLEEAQAQAARDVTMGKGRGGKVKGAGSAGRLVRRREDLELSEEERRAVEEEERAVYGEDFA